jgi:hypothetical protein
MTDPRVVVSNPSAPKVIVNRGTKEAKVIRLKTGPEGPRGPAGPPLDTMVGFVAHGDNPDVQRPLTYASVLWIGTQEPTNSIDNDIWLNLPI